MLTFPAAVCGPSVGAADAHATYFTRYDGCLGTVRFVGKHDVSGQPRLGIELDQASGKNNGTVAGCRYFGCAMNHGILVKPTKVTLSLEPAPAYLDTAPVSGNPSELAIRIVHPKRNTENKRGRCANAVQSPGAGLVAFLTVRIRTGVRIRVDISDMDRGWPVVTAVVLVPWYLQEPSDSEESEDGTGFT